MCLGNVSGSFTIALPDGRLQTTTYTATHEGGFVADVSYEGVPQYPAAAAHPVAHHAPLAHHVVAHPAALVAHPAAHVVAHPLAHGPLVHHG